jgi:hypothetical protein
LRVIECNYCGELLQAGNDDDLVGAIRGHMQEQHPDAQVDEGEIRSSVEQNAYSATDA